MKVCVFGAGAIGGHLAVRLGMGGAEVSVVARGAQLDAIRSGGLTVRAHDGEHRAATRAGSAAELGPQDAVVVTVKAPALPSVADAIAPLLGPDTAVFFVMNGVPWWYFDRHGGALDGTPLPELDPGGSVRAAIGVDRAVGGVIYSACTVVEPGVIDVASPLNRVFLGEPDGRPSPRAEALAAFLRRAGFEAPVTADIRKEVWTKLAANLSNGPLCILSRRGMQETLADPVLRDASVACMRETIAIAAGLGVSVDMDPEKRVAQSAAVRHKPSILQDLEMGKPMEIEAMLAAPLRLARLTGVATPTLDLTVALAKSAARAAGLYDDPAGNG